MTRCLVDVNVWFALVVRQHRHHDIARAWYETLAADEACMCRLVQLGLIRLLGNATILGPDAISATAAWSLISALFQDERVQFIQEPALLDSYLPSFWTYPIPTGKLVNDAYMVAFAASGPYRLVTLDQGFRQFRGVDVELLSAEA